MSINSIRKSKNDKGLVFLKIYCDISPRIKGQFLSFTFFHISFPKNIDEALSLAMKKYQHGINCLPKQNW